jgi:hypothetical protein
MSELPGVHDFDFLHGRWSVQARRLKERLVRCDEWVEFDAELTTWPLLDGYGNVDDFRTDWGGGLVGAAFRLFDPRTGLWSIFWVGKANPVMDTVPAVGRFDGDVGVFEAEEEIDGRPTLVRLTWTRVTNPQPHWEQAFSIDGGTTWETNWAMDYTRIGDHARVGTGG